MRSFFIALRAADDCAGDAPLRSWTKIVHSTLFEPPFGSGTSFLPLYIRHGDLPANEVYSDSVVNGSAAAPDISAIQYLLRTQVLR